nr:envelope glycoprotein N [Mastomys natalensis cytomegalovirus 3]WEG70319.1 envelope glycoprotein N [Mastomys natalensis cytomegalovirus 3]WEG70459.1 envelope glycoprotein N [Mastomys natalensis cytomegalovirus 3]WEG70599.1 envelope glycoprotein N [Mastomys natalensis cytomegalovirus 3]WEG70879.1 envelope glycoprotein N [Mastomys natalensis cytomegalovirus 3]
MSTEKLTGRGDGERCGREGFGMSAFIRFCDSRMGILLCFVVFVMSCIVPTCGENGRVESDGTALLNVDNFFEVNCHSHFYELSIQSFASVWMMINAVVFFCAFSVFLKHWCYKAFTSDTAKGY